MNVGTALLKNKLSYYLHKVQRGERIVVTDHGVPVARLVPLGADLEKNDPQAKLNELASLGLIRLAVQKNSVKHHPKLDLGGNLASKYLLDDREG